MPLVQLHDDLWVVQRPLSFFGMALGTRMTVVRFGEELLLHSPVAPTDAILEGLAQLGNVRWVVGPNTFHHMALGAWIERGAEPWAVPGLVTKRTDLTFAGRVGRDNPPWSTSLTSMAMSGLPFTDEAVFLHEPSRTLIVTDLLMNLSSTSPAFTRLLMRMAGGYPGVRCSHLERVLMKRPEGRVDLRRILEWDFDRIVLAHGEVIETGGKPALHHAYRWLLREQAALSA